MTTYGPLDWIGLLLGVILGLFLYFLPFFIAALKEKRTMFLIGVVDLFFGWTILGWMVCLAWALTPEPKTAP